MLAPHVVKKIFNRAEEPTCGEESLWRERAARLTLDALGHTSLISKPIRHNDAVRYARRWFRGMFDNHPDPKMVDSASATFDEAGVLFKEVRDAVLAVEPHVFQDKEDENVSNN